MSMFPPDPGPRSYLSLWPMHPAVISDILMHFILLYYEETRCYPTHLQLSPKRYACIQEPSLTFLVPFHRLEWLLGLTHEENKPQVDQSDQSEPTKKTTHTVIIEPSNKLKWYQVRCLIQQPSQHQEPAASPSSSSDVSRPLPSLPPLSPLSPLSPLLPSSI